MTDQESQSGSVIHRERDPIIAYPRNVTFDNLIASNKRKSVLLMVAMFLLLIVLGSVLAPAIAAWSGADLRTYWPSVVFGAIAAAIFAGLAGLWSFYGGSNAVLAMAGAKELAPGGDQQLENVVEELSIAAGIPKPKIYLIECDALNAFATGRDPEHGVVAITTGLRQKLSRDELAGVIAHEISHIRHYDIRFAMLMATLVGLTVFASDAFLRTMWYGSFSRGGRRGGGKGGGAAVAIFLLIGLVLAILAPLLAMVIKFAVSRQREYLADAGAVELTRYPQGLIGALEKLGNSTVPLKKANRATAHMYIVSPLKKKRSSHEINSFMRTHPPLRDRVARLKSLIT